MRAALEKLLVTQLRGAPREADQHLVRCGPFPIDQAIRSPLSWAGAVRSVETPLALLPRNCRQSSANVGTGVVHSNSSAAVDKRLVVMVMSLVLNVALTRQSSIFVGWRVRMSRRSDV